MKNIFALLFVALFSTGCTSGSATSPMGNVAFGCVDVHNAGATNLCSPAATAFSAKAVVIDAGTVSVGQMIEVTVNITNNTAADYQGYWSATFDAGCNGAATWEIAPVQQTPLIQAGQSWSTTVGGQCGDMPLGVRTMTGVAYDVDATTQLDEVIVGFTLVQ